MLWLAAAGVLAATAGREIHRPWDSLFWAIEGLALFLVAPRLPARAAPIIGGSTLLLAAAGRSAAIAFLAAPPAARFANANFFVAAAVVAILAIAGVRARAIPEEDESLDYNSAVLRSAAWLVAAILLAAIFWTEPSGVGRGLGLAAEMVAAAMLARAAPDPAFPLAAIGLAGATFVRLFLVDAGPAAQAAATLANPWAVSRVLASLGGAFAGWTLSRVEGQTAEGGGRAVMGLSWLELIAALSVAWLDHTQMLSRAIASSEGAGAVRALWFRFQLGLSALWAVYAGICLALGFLWSTPPLRYASLGLLGITVAKVFLVDMSEVEAIWRVLSFLVLGLVLLGVSVLYQRRLK